MPCGMGVVGGSRWSLPRSGFTPAQNLLKFSSQSIESKRAGHKLRVLPSVPKNQVASVAGSRRGHRAAGGFRRPGPHGLNGTHTIWGLRLWTGASCPVKSTAMPILILFAAIVAAVWCLVLSTRGSLLAASALYLVIAAVMGYQFCHFDIAGISLSMDRLALVGLMAGFVIQWKMNIAAPKRWNRAEYWLLGFVAILLISMFAHDWRRAAPQQVPILQHFLEGYGIPVALYVIARHSPYSPRNVHWLYAVLGVFGIYLSLTAVCEIAGCWSLVYPRYIADAEVGIHFGRARGPFVQSVRLGIFLTATLATVWVPLMWRQVWGRPGVLAGLAASGLHCLAMVLTLTRSIWMGLSWGILVVVGLTFTPRARRFTLYAFFVAAALVIPLKDSLLSFQREYGSQETLESTRMRVVFAYVSWLMFQDHPWQGVGFGHFPHEKEKYLGDRSSDLRLESIRGYIHHNTYLSLLVELGLPGLLTYLALLWTWGLEAWRLWRDRQAPPEFRGHALVALVLLGSYMIQMMFHELSYSPFENGILFLTMGLLSGMYAVRGRGTVAAWPVRPLGPSALHAME